MKQTQALHYLETTATWIILATVFLFPLFFNPYTANLFELNKQILLAISTSLLLVIWMTHNMISKSFRITVSPVTGPLGLLTLIIFGTSISNSIPRTLETFILGANLPVFLFFFFLAATTVKTTKKLGEKMLLALTLSAALLGVLAILETVNLGPGLFVSEISNTQISPDVFISPAGSAVILISFLIPALIMSLVLAISKNNYVTKTILFAASAVITSALVISAFTILPGKPNAPTFLPFGTSWTIAAENVKSPRNFLIGVGTNNYIKAFSTSRGVEFNQYEFWNTRFNAARNYPLHLFTTNGIIGLLAWFFLLFMIVRIVRKATKLSWVGRSSLMGLGAILLVILTIPSNVVLTATFVFLLAILILDLKTHKDPVVSELLLRLFAAKLVDSEHVEQQQKQLRTEVLPLVIGVPTLLLALFVFYGSYRVMAADMAFRASLVAAADNNGTQTYEKQRLAIQRNPYLSNYHRSYASTNLALANTIGAQENVSDQDRNTISTLIRQAIREGQNAVRINPDNPANWETLATIYRNLINAADGATQWAISSYAQAINLDRTNPRLWLDVGGVFYQLQNYPQAIEAFQRAAALKPDWANAHYNLANAYARNQEFRRAIAEYDAVLALVEPTSADYTRAVEEQNALKAELGEAETTAQPQPAELTSPEPIPTPLPGVEQFELTDEDAPPAGDEAADENAGFRNVIDEDGEATPAGETESEAETN